ncbi:hypothetical protein EV127DRAFT_360831 [Xylaria flabelliformis]|nr:hypothetical protein EV127DRAFT_360831 [Xylaria flabelliformis]
MGLSSDRSVAEPPHANDIDIITFCVQSEPIAEFFEWELRITLDSSHTIRFRKPFKAVIKNISRIKEQLLKLENNFGSVYYSYVQMTESVKQSQLNTAEIKADRKESDPLSFDKPAALPHFQSFVAFVDKYLGKQINLYNRLREAKEERVAFENLWMLFESMDTIYCPLREVGQDEKINLFDDTGNRPKHKPIRRHTPQAYRVVTASWGTPRQSFFASSKTRKFINTSIAPRKVDLPVLSEEIAPAVPISTRIGSIIVDVKLAFEGDWDIKNQSIEVPEFNSRSDYALGRQLEDYYDVQGKPSCSNPWCYGESCVGDVYRESYERGRYNIMSEMRLVLEEYETLKQRGSTGRKQFRHLMEDKDMVRLLPGTVPGFALRSRRWVLLDINLLREVEQNSEWDNLFLPPGHQDMVQALVETHTSGREGTKGMDLVRGKGKGCIILLHGVPGVGKTSTAECVATHTKKPLYPITCGDIGYYAEDVERNMETHFKLAHRWGCVLLLDEADVFLAKRDQKDIERNGLVSVFLRILEYYSGILFLTTNRVGAIDDAFRSRLHLILYYPKLAKGQTNNIFTYNFKRIAAINIEREKNNLLPFEYTNTEDEILKWAKKNYKNLGWNGRQIRNAFQTVLALSEFKAKGKKNKSKNSDKQANPVVKLRYFKVVANAMNQFNEYLKATHGYDEDRVAKRDFIRAAEFSPKSHPLLTETEDSSDQDSDEGDSNESDPDRSKSKYDRDQSDDSDSDLDHGKTKKKKSKARAKKESGSKSVTKKTKKVKDDSAKSEKQSKDKRKDKGEKEDTEDSE